MVQQKLRRKEYSEKNIKSLTIENLNFNP